MPVEAQDGLRFILTPSDDLNDPFNNQLEWPRLSCPQANQLALEFGELRIDESLTVNNAIATKQLSVSDSVTGSLTIENDLTVNNEIKASKLQIVREGWTYLDIRCFKEGEDAVIRLYDGEHYWSIHNDDSAGNKLDIRSNNSSKMSLTPEGNLDVTGIIKAKSYKTSIYKAGGIDSGQISLSNSNRWADFPNLSITFSLSEPATVIAFYKISMNAPNSSHLVTRLLVNNRDVSRTIVGNTYYWGNSDFWSDELSEGTHSIQVQYRTPEGGINNPAGTDWNNRVLRVMVLGS